MTQQIPRTDWTFIRSIQKLTERMYRWKSGTQQDRFNEIHPSFFSDAHSCILTFDVTRKKSYENLENWYNKMRKYRKDIPCLVIGNKIDLDMKATKRKFYFASKRDLPFEYVSASSGVNVVKVFKKAIADGVKYQANPSKYDIFQDVKDLLVDKKEPEEEEEEGEDGEVEVDDMEKQEMMKHKSEEVNLTIPQMKKV